MTTTYGNHVQTTRCYDQNEEHVNGSASNELVVDNSILHFKDKDHFLHVEDSPKHSCSICLLTFQMVDNLKHHMLKHIEN